MSTPVPVAEQGNTPTESSEKPKRSFRIPRIQTFDSLSAYRDYRLLWIGNFFSNSAQWMQLLTIGWLVRDLTSGSSSSALLVVTVGGMSMLPGLVVGPIGGTLGDRVDRRKLIMGIQIFMALFALAFAFMVGLQLVTVWHAYIYVFVSGIFLSITQPMRQALIANTVPRESLGNAYATNVLTIPGTRMIGPFIGGIMIATLGFFWNFTLEAVFYAATVLVYLPMKTPFARPRVIKAGQSLTSDLIDGFKYVSKDNKVLLYMIVLSMIPNTLLQPLMFLLPVFTEEVLRRGPDVGGFFLAINGLGGFLMALAISAFGFRYGKGKIILVMAIGSSVFTILFAYAFWLPLAFFLILLFAATQTAFRTTNGTLVQLIVPDEMRGRVTSLQRYGMGGVVPASIIIGWFAGITSVSIALVVMGVLALGFSILFAVISRQIRALE